MGLTKKESFESLEEGWSHLLPYSSSNTIFITPLWQKTWWGLLGKDHRLALLALERAGTLEGIAPLVCSNGKISFLGGTDLFDYHDFILPQGKEAPFFSSLLDYLAHQQWHTLELTSLLATSPTLKYLPPLAQERGFSVLVSTEDVCPGVSLPSSWDEYLTSLSKKDRHELRRKMRRLEGAGEVRFYASSEGLEDDLDDFLKLLRSSADEKSRFLTPEREQFFRRMALALVPTQHLQLWFMELNGVRVSALMCFDYDDRRLLYNSGYDPLYAYLSVGLLAKAYCLRDAIEKGKSYFDFLRGAEPYKYDLGATDVPLYRIVVER